MNVIVSIFENLPAGKTVTKGTFLKFAENIDFQTTEYTAIRRRIPKQIRLAKKSEALALLSQFRTPVSACLFLFRGAW